MHNNYRAIFLFFIFIYSGALYGKQPFSIWKKVRTEHFIIVYEEKDSTAAREILTFCEEAYDLVSSYFHSYPKTIQCVVSGRSDASGGYFQYFPTCIKLDVSSPSTFWIGGRTENWLRILLIHELTHFIHISYEKGFFAAISHIFGDTIKIAHSPFIFSRWMIEGISTNLETLFTRGGRGRNPFFELYYKAMAVEDNFFSFPQANYSSSYSPPGRDYIAGYIMVKYLFDTYGNDVFVRIHNEYIAFPFLGVEKAIIAVTGKSSREIFYETKHFLKQKYKYNRAIAGGVRISPKAIGDYRIPAITERGIFYYRETPDKHPAIVCLKEETGEEVVIIETHLSDESSFSVNAKGDTLVFSSFDFDYRYPSFMIISSDLYEYSLQSDSVKRLTTNAHLHHPVLFPDGKTILAVQRTGSYSRLVEIDRLTGNISLLFALKETTIYNPVVSPDGKQCAFVLNIRGMQDIYLLDIEKTHRHPLTLETIPETYNIESISPLVGPDEDDDYYPRFLDTNRILFTSDRNGNLALYIYSFSHDELSLVCEDPVGAFAGCTTDSHLIYTSYTTDGFCLKAKPIQTLIPAVLTKPEAEVPAPPFEWQHLPESEAFTDLAYPLFWLPYLSIDFNQPSNSGGGIYLTGISLLGTSLWHLIITFHPEVMQPQIIFSALFHINEIGITYNLNHNYQHRGGEEPSFHQTIKQNLSMDIPVISSHKLSLITSLSFTLGIAHTLALFQSSPFSFFNAFNLQPISLQNQYGLLSGANFTIGKTGGPMDFYSPLQFHTAISSYTSLPLFPESYPGFRLVSNISLNLPSLLPHNVIKPVITGSYTSERLLLLESPFSLPILTSRVMFPDGKQEEEGRLLFSLDYLFPIALMDQPLAFGFYLLRCEGDIYFEYIAGYQFQEPFFIPRRFLYGGTELTFTFGHGSFTFPLTMGVGLRYDIESCRCNIMEDVIPYINIVL
jgi:hypothetical protein